MPLLGSLTMDDITMTYIGKCPVCKRRFSYTKYHRYVRVDRGQKIKYCSYTCFRVFNKKDEEEARKRFEEECARVERKEQRDRACQERRKARGAGRSDYPILTSKEECEAYMQKAREQIRAFSSKLIDAEPDSAERKKAHKNLQRWERKYAFAKKSLKEYK